MPLMAVPLTGLDGTTDLFQPPTAETKPCVCIELFQIELSQFYTSIDARDFTGNLCNPASQPQL